MTDHFDLARTTYRIALGREASDEEAATVVRALDAGDLTPLDFVASVLASPEAAARLAPAAPPTATLESDMHGDGRFAEYLERVRPYTMTGTANLYATFDACRYLAREGIPGDVVECGVWRGGMCMLMALALAEFEEPHRTIWLYDTFAGMTQPTEHDLRHDGARAADMWAPAPDGPGSKWWPADVDEVRANLASTSYPDHLLRFVVGPVENTVPEYAPDRIALLRLDTDWYASTLVELDHLYPRVERGGVVVVDDYGWWTGSRRAVDEYFGRGSGAPLLSRIDPAGSRLMVKP